MRLWDRLIRRDGYWEGMSSGASVLTTSYASPDREPVLPQLAAFAQQAHSSNSPVFAAILLRMSLFSEATFRLQALDDKHLYGNTSLSLLEEPFGADSSTGDLLARMEQDVSLAGNSYTWAPPGEGRLIRLRPDWVTIVSERVRVDSGTDRPGWYRRPVGYWFEPPKGVLDRSEGFLVPAGECAHFGPLPDPAADFRGMSWLTPVMRDVQGDDGMGRYKIRYLQNDASPNVIIKYAQRLQEPTIDKIRERVNARYGGPDNAGKTLILDQGADLTLVGNSLQQMDFSNVATAGEQRILAAAMVPGVLVGLEPLRGAGRGYQESMQKFANIWARPQWRAACGVLKKLVPGLPSGARLWFDVSDIAALQEGETARAQAALVRAQALLALVQAGYTHESAMAAVESGDLSQLKAAPAPVPPPAGNVQHLLPQTSPGAAADPLPATMPRLPVGSTSPGDGGNNTRPTPRPASARRALEGANGRG